MNIFRKPTLIIILFLYAQIAFSQWVHTYSLFAWVDIATSNFSFSSPQYGWGAYKYVGTPSGSDEFAISRTDDYGLHWNEISYASYEGLSAGKILTAGHDTAYFFINHTLGVKCRYTFDAGQHFYDFQIPINATWAVDASLINRDTIIFTSNKGRLFKMTHDTAFCILQNDTLNFEKSRISVMDSKNVYILAKDIQNNSLLLYSNDGGDSWSSRCATKEFSFKDFFFSWIRFFQAKIHIVLQLTRPQPYHSKNLNSKNSAVQIKTLLFPLRIHFENLLYI